MACEDCNCGKKDQCGPEITVPSGKILHHQMPPSVIELKMFGLIILIVASILVINYFIPGFFQSWLL